MKLGEKIKFLRKERNLTQAHLAGDAITRSMLCEIERGKAFPSLDTLRYIADALSVPMAYLLDESEDVSAYHKREALSTIHRLYLSGKYAECFRLCESLPGEPDDELAFILSLCAYAEGKNAFRSGNMETALVYFEEAASYAQKTVYPTDGIEAGLSLYRALSENVAAPRRDFDEALYLRKATTAIEWELYAYMKDDPTYPYSNDLYAIHVETRLLLHELRYREALPRLLALEARKGEEGVSAYFLFRLYSDIEVCFREEKQFEKAYKYASKRMTLLSAFQS